MVTAFQRSAFQNNAFQISTATDTHDGLPRKIYLPIYETKKKKPLTTKQSEEYLEALPNIRSEPPKIPDSPQKIPNKWDYSAIEAYAIKAAMTFSEAERRIKAFQKMQEEEEEEFELMVLAAHSIH